MLILTYEYHSPCLGGGKIQFEQFDSMCPRHSLNLNLFSACSIQTYNARVKRSVREQIRMASAIIFSVVSVPLIDFLVKFVLAFILLGILKSLIRFNS